MVITRTVYDYLYTYNEKRNFQLISITIEIQYLFNAFEHFVWTCSYSIDFELRKTFDIKTIFRRIFHNPN